VERPRLHQVAAGQRVTGPDLGGLLAGTGAELLLGRATEIDLARRTVLVDAPGPVRVPYDTLVYALGSTIDLDAVPGVREHCHALSDPEAAVRLRDAARRLDARGGTVAVCGGGRTAIEAATELAEAYPRVRVRLVSRERLGGRLCPTARDHLRRACSRLGIEARVGEVVRVRPRALALADGSAEPFDACLWAGGFAVPALAREAGLAVTAAGRVVVDGTLRSVSHPEVYAVGDAAAGAPRAPFTFRPLHQCISLGRRDAIIQFVHAGDERPRRQVLTGRAAVWYKELVLAGGLWVIRTPGQYPRRWPARAATPGRAAVAVARAAAPARAGDGGR
jgi:NADH dehydrogenase FAD-containing subunit